MVILGLSVAKLLTAVQKSSILTIERFVGGGEKKRVENVAKLLFFINDGGREEIQMASISINLLPTPTS